jgi:hypothetical protein
VGPAARLARSGHRALIPPSVSNRNRE